MGSHLLRLFEVPAIGQVDGDPRRPEGVAADFGLNAGPPSSPADHVEGVLPIVSGDEWENRRTLSTAARRGGRPLGGQKGPAVIRCWTLLEGLPEAVSESRNMPSGKL
jgi:hypothetical protein